MVSSPFHRLWRKPWPRPGFIKRYMAGLDSNMIQAPVALDILWRYRTEELKVPHPKPQRFSFPEQQYINYFLAKYPEAKLEPIRLNSFQVPLAKAFALRAMALQQAVAARQLPPAEAQRELQRALQQAEEEVKPQLAAATREGGVQGSVVSMLQVEEEKQLQAGLQALEQLAQQQAQAAAAGQQGGSSKQGLPPVSRSTSKS